MIRVINRSGEKIVEDELRESIYLVLKEEIGDVNVNIVFVTIDEMKSLNKEFMGIEEPTDVLTFPYHDEDVYGEVIICPEVVRKNAERFSVAYEDELMSVMVHGILHLAGYDHERENRKADEMFKKQREYVERIKGEGKKWW